MSDRLNHFKKWDIFDSLFERYEPFAFLQILTYTGTFILSLLYILSEACFDCDKEAGVITLGYTLLLLYSITGGIIELWNLKTNMSIAEHLRLFRNTQSNQDSPVVKYSHLKYHSRRKNVQRWTTIQNVSSFLLWLNGITFASFGVIIWMALDESDVATFPFTLHCALPFILCFNAMSEYIRSGARIRMFIGSPFSQQVYTQP